MSVDAATILETDKLLEEGVNLAKEQFDLYHAHIYLLNPANDTLELAIGAGEIGRQMVAQGRSIPLHQQQSIVAQAARNGTGLIENDLFFRRRYCHSNNDGCSDCGCCRKRTLV